MYLLYLLWLFPWHSRPFEMDLPVYYKTAKWKIGDNITFPLSNNITATGVIQYLNVDGSYISGPIYPIPFFSNATGVFTASFYKHSCNLIKQCETTISANIKLAQGILFRLLALPNGKYQIIRENFTNTHGGTIMDGPENDAKPSLRRRTHKTSASYSPPTLKVLVLYTKQAVSELKGENNMLALILLAIGNFNLILHNSGILGKVEYVAERIQEYDTYVEDADMGVTLGKMGGTISTSRRFVLGCHAVHLITSETMYCGIADYSGNGLTSGYSVSFFGCSAGYYSLAHEIGHNLGLHHDISAFNGVGFNKGYCWDIKNTTACHRSVMSYGSCLTPLGKSNCDRVAFFSNGETTDMGSHVGIKGQYDNAQQFRNNIWNFMNQFSPFFVSAEPTFEPTVEPSLEPTYEPSTYYPSLKPTIKPSYRPSLKPTVRPSFRPSYKPSYKPTFRPTVKPSICPSIRPTKFPTYLPSYPPTRSHIFKPVLKSTIGPTILPTTDTPSFEPTLEPSVNPTTPEPSVYPSVEPTLEPTGEPTEEPTTQRPSKTPTYFPSRKPTYKPSIKPSKKPTRNPSMKPTGVPSVEPSIEPTEVPSVEPSIKPTWVPSVEPSIEPTGVPSIKPTCIPSQKPTPTQIPTRSYVVIDSLVISPSSQNSTVLISTIVSVSCFLLCVLCAFKAWRSRTRKQKPQRRPTGEIAFNTVYVPNAEKEEYNNDFRERLQSISPIRLETRMTTVVPLEQENLSSDKIMHILFDDTEYNNRADSSYDNILIKEPEILNEEFTFSHDETVPNPKNSMRYIKSSHIDTRFEDDTETNIPPPPPPPPPPPAKIN